jgi:hypothetical protein
VHVSALLDDERMSVDSVCVMALRASDMELLVGLRQSGRWVLMTFPIDYKFDGYIQYSWLIWCPRLQEERLVSLVLSPGRYADHILQTRMQRVRLKKLRCWNIICTNSPDKLRLAGIFKTFCKTLGCFGMLSVFFCFFL